MISSARFIGLTILTTHDCTYLVYAKSLNSHGKYVRLLQGKQRTEINFQYEITILSMAPVKFAPFHCQFRHIMELCNIGPKP